MRVFVIGTSRFVGSATVKELIDVGHLVIGLAPSEEAAKKVNDVGVEVLRDRLEDLDILKQSALQTEC